MVTVRLPSILLRRIFILFLLTVVLVMFLGGLQYYAVTLSGKAVTRDRANDRQEPGILTRFRELGRTQAAKVGDGDSGGGVKGEGGSESKNKEDKEKLETGNARQNNGGEQSVAELPRQNVAEKRPQTPPSSVTRKAPAVQKPSSPPQKPKLITIEKDPRPFRALSPSEQAGDNIVFTLRSTLKFHQKRLPLLMDTWMSKVNCSRIYLVTDGPDPKTEAQVKSIGMHYYTIDCGKSYRRDDLCCKAGAELEVIFLPGNEHYDWLCHIDDDMYVFLDGLVRILSKFDPKKEPVYLGRSAADPRKVHGRLGPPGTIFYFGVGGMYCLSRPMLEEAKPYLVGGQNFARSCSETLEPEDVTVGTVVGAVLKHGLINTGLITSHGVDISKAVRTFKDQVAISYGYGAVKWSKSVYNAVDVPGALYTHQEDPSQFRSLHCHLYPDTSWCLAKKGLGSQHNAPGSDKRLEAIQQQQQKLPSNKLIASVKDKNNHPS